MNTARAAVPAGFKFTPTDEELISNYLVPMLSGVPAPPMITTADIYKTEPWNLPPEAFVHGDRSNEAFFLTPRRCTAIRGNCSRAQRAAGSGIWQINSKYVPVYDAYGQKVIGSKAPLVFTVNSAHTGWIMYEYISRDGAMFQTHALCRIYKKARRESIYAMTDSCPTKRPTKKQQNAHEETAEVKLQEAFMKMKEEASIGHAMASGPMAWGPALAAFLIKSKVEGPHDPPVQDEVDEQIQSPVLLPLQSPIPSPPRPPASWAQPSSFEPPPGTLDEFHGRPLIDPEELEEFRQDGKRWEREAAMDFLSDQPPIGVDIDTDYFYDSTFFC